jgi:hypothetical protein
MGRTIRAVAVGSSLLFLSAEAAPAAMPAPACSCLAVGRYTDRVVRALKLLQRLLDSKSGGACANYFEERGWSIRGGFGKKATLVIFTETEFPGSAWDAYGLAQTQSPWTVIYLNRRKLAEQSWPRLDDCTLASILLHEMGHLARRDMYDDEPSDFFHECRVGCLEPGRWR